MKLSEFFWSVGNSKDVKHKETAHTFLAVRLKNGKFELNDYVPDKKYIGGFKEVYHSTITEEELNTNYYLHGNAL